MQMSWVSELLESMALGKILGSFFYQFLTIANQFQNFITSATLVRFFTSKNPSMTLDGFRMINQLLL